MNRRHPRSGFCRFLGLLLCLSLPNPAFALRQAERVEARGGLEELEQALQSPASLESAAGTLAQRISFVLGIPAQPSIPSAVGLEEWQGHMDRVRTALGDRSWNEFIPLYHEAAELSIRSLQRSFTNPQLSRDLNQLLRESYAVPRADISDHDRGQFLGTWQTNVLTYLFLTGQVEEETARLFLQDPERELYFWYYNHRMWSPLALHMPVDRLGLRGQWEAHLWMDSLALLMAQSPRTSPGTELETHRPQFWQGLIPSLVQNLSRGKIFLERSPQEVLSAGDPSVTMRQQVEALGPVSQELKVAVLLRKNEAAYNLAAVYSGLTAQTATKFGYKGTAEVWRRAAVARYNQARLENPDGALWVPPGHYAEWRHVDTTLDAADDLSVTRPSEADPVRKAERAAVLRFFHSQNLVQSVIQQLGTDILDPIVENPQNVAALLDPVINLMRKSKQTGVRNRVGSVQFREGLQRALAEVRRDAQARLGKSMNLGEYKDWAARIISEERWAELDSASEVAIGILSEWRNSSKPFGQVVQQNSESLRVLDQLVRAELGRPAMGRPADPAQRIAIQRWVASAVALLTVSNRLSSRTANAFLQDPERLEGYLWRVLDLFWKDFIRNERAAEFGLQLPPEIILPPSQVNEASSLWLDATQLLRFSTTFEQDDLERGDYEQAQVQIPTQVWPGMIADYDRTRQASRVPSANWIHAHRQLLGQLQSAVPLHVRRAFLLREFSAVENLSGAFHDYVSALARSQNLSEAAQVFDQMAQARYEGLSRVSPNFSIWKPSLTTGLEELDAKVREAILAFQAEPEEQKRLSALEVRLRGFQPFQRTRFFGALPWLPDERKVSNLLSVAFTADSQLAQKVRRQLLAIVQENRDSSTANTETVLRILLARMPWENSAEIARKITISAAMQPAGAKGIDILLPAVVSIGAAESTIRNFRKQAKLQSRDLYHRLALSHELIADSYEKMGAITPPGPIRNEIERSRQVEQAYIFLYEAIAQTILAVGPNAGAILELNDRGNGRASYEFSRGQLLPLAASPNLYERLMALGRLEELEQTYADLLITTKRIDLSPSQHNDAARRFQEQRETLIRNQQQLLGLVPAAGLEEGEGRQIADGAGPMIRGTADSPLAISPGPLLPAGLEELSSRAKALDERIRKVAADLQWLAPFGINLDDPHTKWAVHLGAHVRGSGSPPTLTYMYNKIPKVPFLQKGIRWVSIPLDTDPADLAETLRAIEEHPKIQLVTVTQPHKIEVGRWAQEWDSSVEPMRTTNHVLIRRDEAGRFLGTIATNSDGPAFVRQYQQVWGRRGNIPGTFQDKTVVILGGWGGLGQALTTSILKEGPRQLILTEIPTRLESARAQIHFLREQLSRLMSHVPEVTPLAADDPALQIHLRAAQVLINATGIGMDDETSPISDPQVFRDNPNLEVLDSIYRNSKGESRPVPPLLRQAWEAGIRHVYNGVGLTMRDQAWEAAWVSRQWFGDSVKIDEEEIYQAVNEWGRKERGLREAQELLLTAGLEEGWKLAVPKTDQRQLFQSYEQMVASLEQELLENRKRAGKSDQLFWVGSSGRVAAGKTELAKRLTQRLLAHGHHAIYLSEDELGVVDRSTRAEWEQAGNPLWEDWRNWLRWNRVYRVIREIHLAAAEAAREGHPKKLTLNELYRRETGRTDEVRSITIHPDTIVVYDAFLLQEMYMPGTFDFRVLVDISAEESISRQLHRDQWRNEATIRRYDQQLYRPLWEEFVREFHPERPSQFIVDLTNFAQPARLFYPQTAILERHSVDFESLQSRSLHLLVEVASRGAMLREGLFSSVYPFPGRPDLVLKVPKPLPLVVSSMLLQGDPPDQIYQKARRRLERQLDSFRLAAQRAGGVVASFRLYELSDDSWLPYVVVQRRAQTTIGDRLRHWAAAGDLSGVPSLFSEGLQLQLAALSQGFRDLEQNFTVNNGLMVENSIPSQRILDLGAFDAHRPQIANLARKDQWSVRVDLPSIHTDLAVWYTNEVIRAFGQLTEHDLGQLWNSKGAQPIQFPQADEAVRQAIPPLDRPPTSAGSATEPPEAGLEEEGSSPDRFKSSGISFDGLIAAAREHGIEAFEIYRDRDEPRPATLAAKVPGNPLTDPDAARGLEVEMRRIFGDQVDRQTYYLRIGVKEGWAGVWAEVVANAGLEEVPVTPGTFPGQGIPASDDKELRSDFSKQVLEILGFPLGGANVILAMFLRGELPFEQAEDLLLARPRAPKSKIKTREDARKGLVFAWVALRHQLTYADLEYAEQVWWRPIFDYAFAPAEQRAESSFRERILSEIGRVQGLRQRSYGGENHQDQPAAKILEEIDRLLAYQTPPTTGGEEDEAKLQNMLEDYADLQGSLDRQGWAPLDAAQASRFLEGAVGGFVIKDSARVNKIGHFVVAEKGLSNPAAENSSPQIRWFKAGEGVQGVIDSAKENRVGADDLLLVKPAEEVSSESMAVLLNENFQRFKMPRVAIAEENQVRVLSPAAFLLLATEKSLPQVVFLNVRPGLKGKADETYTLLLMV